MSLLCVRDATIRATKTTKSKQQLANTRNNAVSAASMTQDLQPAATNWDIEEPPASSHRRLQVFRDSQPTIDVDAQPIFSDSHETR